MIILVNNLSGAMCCICLGSFDHIRQHRVTQSCTEECFLLLSIYFHWIFSFVAEGCRTKVIFSWYRILSLHGIQIISSGSWPLRPYENPSFMKPVTKIVLACETSRIMLFSNCYAVFPWWTVGRNRGLLPWLHASKLFCITNAWHG